MKLFDQLALEEAKIPADTTIEAENEVIIYAKISDFEGLKEATSFEDQLQLNAKYTTGHVSRVRKITKGEEVTHEHTFKLNNNDNADDEIQSNVEYNSQVDSDFFDGFKHLAETVTDKTRYTFASSSVLLSVGEGEDKKNIEIPGVNYEVDVFKNDAGEHLEECKIDVEVDVILSYLAANHPELKNIKLKVGISHLPFKPLGAIIDLSASPEDKEVINSYWKKWSKDPLQEIANVEEEKEEE